jgi:3-deoxy-7-phosphoheptulonate synthase
MVVVMGPDATAEQLDAVVRTVQGAGGSAFVSRGVHRTIVGLVGDVEQFETLNLRALPGVIEVVRISTPYKLVSRENHPATSTVTVLVCRSVGRRSP